LKFQVLTDLIHEHGPAIITSCINNMPSYNYYLLECDAT